MIALTGGAAYFGVRGMGSMEEYDASAAASRVALSNAPELGDFVRHATLAASGHNTQPWKFHIAETRIDIMPDFSRRTPAVDPDDHHLFVSLGCAAENLAIAAGSRGRPGALSFEPSGEGSVALTFGGAPSGDPALADAIARRQSTRSEYDGRDIDAAGLRSLAAAAAVPGVDLILLTHRSAIDRVRDLVIAGNDAQMADASFTRELSTWLRFSPRQATRTGDGLFTATSGSPIMPEWLGPTIFKWFFTAAAENDKYARQIKSSTAIAIFVSKREDHEHWVLAGRAAQRFGLQATRLGLAHCFINQPVEVASLRPELAALAGLPGRRPDLVMRLGHAPPLPFSARRPARTVLI